MEELFVLALLLRAGIVSEDEYRKRLDELFLNSSDNNDLLQLECETNIKMAIIYLRIHIDYNSLDCELFGRI